MNKKYFRFLLEDKKIAIAFFLILYTFFCWIPFISGGDYDVMFMRSLRTGFIVSVAMTFVLPILLFAFVHRRRSADLYFALPVKRKELLITNIVFMFVLCFGFYLVASLLIWLIPAHMGIPFVKYLAAMGYAAVGILILLLVHSLMYLVANNIFDGVVVLFGYAILPLVIYMVSLVFFALLVAGRTFPNGELATSFSPVCMITSMGTSLINWMNTHMVYQFPGYRVLLLPVVYGILAVFGLKKEFVERKSERAEQLSDNFFAYPFLIRIYAYSILLGLAFAMARSEPIDYLPYYALLLVSFVISTFVYKRKISMNWKMLAEFVIAVALTVGFAKVSVACKGFGLSKAYTVDKGKYLAYDYYSSGYDENLVKKSDGNVAISFTLFIPVEEKEKYDDVIDVLESYRGELIDRFYEENDSDLAYTCFDVYNTNEASKNVKTFNYYSYSVNGYSLKTEDLKKIAKYTDVWVYDITKDLDEVNLTDYLERKQ